MRFDGMKPRCPKCAPDLFCPSCTEDYGQAFAKSAHAEGFTAGRRAGLEEAARIVDEEVRVVPWKSDPLMDDGEGTLIAAVAAIRAAAEKERHAGVTVAAGDMSRSATASSNLPQLHRIQAQTAQDVQPDCSR